LPFFRKAVSESVEPSLIVKECFKFCTSKGLDLFGFVDQRRECRCGASIENHDFWGDYQELAEARGLQLSTKPPSMEKGAACKGVEVFQYVKWKEQTRASGIVEDLKHGIDLVSSEESPEDVRYMRGIVEVALPFE